jgi:hypothetical protein
MIVGVLTVGVLSVGVMALFHSDLISLFEKLDKNIEIGNNE